MVDKKNYSNLVNNIARERREIKDSKKDYSQVDQILNQKFSLKRPPCIRVGVSLTEEEIEMVKQIRGRLVQLNHLEIPSNSEIYRAGVHLLKELSTEEINEIIKSIN